MVLGMILFRTRSLVPEICFCLRQAHHEVVAKDYSGIKWPVPLEVRLIPLRPRPPPPAPPLILPRQYSILQKQILAIIQWRLAVIRIHSLLNIFQESLRLNESLRLKALLAFFWSTLPCLFIRRGKGNSWGRLVIFL